MKTHQICITNRNAAIRYDGSTSLLSALERNGFPHEYQCRSGYCGACRVKMTKGRVSYQETPLAFLKPDEILLCCCQAEEDLEIEF